ncbi:hypothetical protein H0H87_002885 [Tephrocybe sp. NHM501043]|nr:hypothetical protein H0H87_002885 [Tephrocybe sp. NHM501043]
MVAIRLRHPSGVSTIQVDLERDDFTVQDLQQEIYAATKILPSRQSLKAGYPPHALTMIPELPIESLGLKPGEQIIVSELPGTTPSPATSTSGSSNSASIVTLSTNYSQAEWPRSRRNRWWCAYTQGKHISQPVFISLNALSQIVPDDNSCLFSAVSLLFEQSIDKAPEMRKIVADGIRGDQSTYNEAILGMPPEQYIATILKPTTWGGAIELTILAAHYNTEIASIDVETGRIDHFSPAAPTGGMRCILIYSGIHYDAATLAPMADAPGEWHQTIFPVSSPDDPDPVMIAAKKLADILRAKKAYTNTSTFDLKCEVCGQGLKGEKDARAHAEQTGHVRFGEY